MSGQESEMAESAYQLERVPICVILARKDIDSPWTDAIWQPVSVILDAPASAHGKIREEGDGWVHYFMNSDPLELHRKDAPAYTANLQQSENGTLWIVLGEEDDPENELPYYVQLVTASPYEAQDYLDSGELIVEVVQMPAQLKSFIAHYVEACPAEEKFIKRKQKKNFSTDHTFGQQPLHDIQKLGKLRPD